MNILRVLLRFRDELIFRLCFDNEAAWTVDDLLHTGSSVVRYYSDPALARSEFPIGKTLEPGRIYLTGRVALERNGVLVDERQLAGRQGRLAFVRLAINHHEPVARDRIVESIWRDGQPGEVDVALAAIVSKLRGALKRVFSEDEARIDVRLGSITLRLPGGIWIDLEQAANAMDEAEGAWRAGDHGRAWSCANVAISIARRQFLVNEEAPWIESQRTRIRTLLIRALDCLSAVSATNGETPLAAQYASEIIELEPFRETAYRQLMRVHVQMGNRAEALRVFERCRELLRDELGASPSPETEALFLSILRGVA